MKMATYFYHIRQVQLLTPKKFQINFGKFNALLSNLILHFRIRSRYKLALSNEDQVSKK